ncbi:ABC transporter permease [Nocardioides fonticola]|uniref:ABC transporter permease n=1 Tax=Nocardioides fonticola TaxID=450363 RepID=A0ABP7XCN7_9ACTN
MSTTTSPLLALSRAILRGFSRDRTSVFFAIVFPLMFLVLFGGLLGDRDTPKLDAVQVGAVPPIDDAGPQLRESLDQSFEITRSDDLAAALKQVREGKADIALEMRGDTLVLHYSNVDAVTAGVAQGTLRSFVDAANLAASGAPSRFQLQVDAVEDDSLSSIQYYTPGLLGWGVATSAAIGAAATLQGWRQSKLLRRLQLAPVSTRTVVAARVLVTLVISLVQMAIFLGVAMAFFGLRLDGAWWSSVPLLLVGTLSFMAMGLLSGAVAKTTEGAVNMANFLVLPMSMLSGSFFPLDGAPRWLDVVSQCLPLRHLNEGMLDVLVRGDGPSAVVVPALILLGFTVVLTLVAARLFRWDTA